MLRIFDAHVHLFDRDANTHQFLEHEVPGFKSIVGATLPQLCAVAREFAQIPFTLGVMGWPLDLSPGGFVRWRQDMQALSRCDNVCVEIAAIECLFGRGWRTQDVAPWVLSLVELFGPARCMFGSHMPIAGLSGGFEPLYTAYRQIVAGCSGDEQDQLFRGTAAAWFAAPDTSAKEHEE